MPSKFIQIFAFMVILFLIPGYNSAREKTSRIWTVVQSAIVPGLGQLSQDRAGAGITYGGLFFTGLFAWQIQNRSWEAARDNQNFSDLLFHYQAGTISETESNSSIVAAKQLMTWRLNQRQFVDQRKSLEIKRKKRDETGAMLAGLYIWNIADAWLFYDSKNESNNSDTLGALWRSAILPGWGQRYQGRSGIGWLYTGSMVVLAMATRSQYHEAQIKRDIYQDNANSFLYTTPAIFTYLISNTANYSANPALFNFIQTQNARKILDREDRELKNMGLVMAGFYIWNLADVFIFADSGSVSFGLSGRSDGLGLQLALRF